MPTLSTFTWLGAFALSAMLVNSLGIYCIYKNKDWAERAKDHLICFAAGVLIYLSASHLLPAVREGEHGHSYLAFLLGVVLTLFIMVSER